MLYRRSLRSEMDAGREGQLEKHAEEEEEGKGATGEGDDLAQGSIHAGMEDRKEEQTEKRPEDRKDDVADTGDVGDAASDKQ